MHRGSATPVENSKERKGSETMSMLDSLRKGFSFLLLSFGVSSPAKKPKPTPQSKSGK
jgi:hypothetical protein